eukprot:XP_001698336.1 predicted protein [Chlamydomonas reinhardtii]
MLAVGKLVLPRLALPWSPGASIDGNIVSAGAKGGTKAMAKGGKDENGKSITAKNMGAKGGTKAMAKGGKDENGKSIAAKNLGESSAVAGLVCGPGRQGNGARDG